MHEPAAAYFAQLHASLGVGVPETSGYPALANLLNSVGDSLKPKISAVIHPANNGAGIPDGALFSAKELRKHGHEPNTLFGKLKPERGVIEVKKPPPEKSPCPAPAKPPPAPEAKDSSTST